MGTYVDWADWAKPVESAPLDPQPRPSSFERLLHKPVVPVS